MQQAYKDALSKVLHGGVSLYPLTTSIQELASAAKEAEDEAKVKSVTFVRHSLFFFPFTYSCIYLN
jgi:hypothetical protein